MLSHYSESPDAFGDEPDPLVLFEAYGRFEQRCFSIPGGPNEIEAALAWRPTGEMLGDLCVGGMTLREQCADFLTKVRFGLASIATLYAFERRAYRAIDQVFEHVPTELKQSLFGLDIEADGEKPIVGAFRRAMRVYWRHLEYDRTIAKLTVWATDEESGERIQLPPDMMPVISANFRGYGKDVDREVKRTLNVRSGKREDVLGSCYAALNHQRHLVSGFVNNSILADELD